MTGRRVPAGRTAADPYVPRAATMTAEERAEFVAYLVQEIARWSVELNRRLA